MKILTVIGSPRTNGNTYKTVRIIEKELVEKNAEIEFEYVQLSKAGFELCKGCYVCIARGEELCPLKDGRESLEMKMKQADAVIFAAPVYTYNVPWMFKNFLDRFAYRCHRPEFYGKKSMVVVSTAAIGLGFVALFMSFMLETMGFITCAKAGVTFPPLHEKDEKKWAKEINKLKRQTGLFYKSLKDTKPVKPSLLKLIIFKMQQKGFSKAPEDSADYMFWENKGWFEKGAAYYYKVHVWKIKRVIAALVSKL